MLGVFGVVHDQYLLLLIVPISYQCSPIAVNPLVTMTENLMKKRRPHILGLITVAVKSAPINSLLLLTNIKPLKIVFEEKATIIYEKLLHLDNFFLE